MIRDGEHAGKHPFVASVYRVLAEATEAAAAAEAGATARPCGQAAGAGRRFAVRPRKDEGRRLAV